MSYNLTTNFTITPNTEEHFKIKLERDQKREKQGQNNIKAQDIESWWNILFKQLLMGKDAPKLTKM